MYIFLQTCRCSFFHVLNSHASIVMLSLVMCNSEMYVNETHIPVIHVFPRLQIRKFGRSSILFKSVLQWFGFRNASFVLYIFFRCPIRRQNYDYGIHLLTVLYHESWVSSWEKSPTCCCSQSLHPLLLPSSHLHKININWNLWKVLWLRTT